MQISAGPNQDFNFYFILEFKNLATKSWTKGSSYIGPVNGDLIDFDQIEDLPNIDVVTISHSHYDHIDYETVKSLSEKFKNIL